MNFKTNIIRLPSMRMVTSTCLTLKEDREVQGGLPIFSKLERHGKYQNQQMLQQIRLLQQLGLMGLRLELQGLQLECEDIKEV